MKRIFKDLLRLEEIGEQNLTRDTNLTNLIRSIRYSRKPELMILDIATKIIEIFICSKYYELSIEQAERNLEELQKELPENSEIAEQEQEQENPEQAEQEELFYTGIEYEDERTLEEAKLIETSVRVAGQSLLPQNINKNLTKGNNVNRRKDNIKCYRCKKMGHYSGECKIKKDTEKVQENKRTKEKEE